MKKSRLDLYLLLPIKSFIERQTSVGLLLIISAALAMIVANSPLAEAYHSLWKQYIHIGINDLEIRKNLLHWINDGLMSIFFFLVGLELKREILHGHLSQFKMAVIPIGAAIGGMVFPALIYYSFTAGTPAVTGWGIPMATDIAFALGILYLLGDKVPLSLKVFLTALAIVDDLGAILVIAFFYTSNVSIVSLVIAAVFLLILFIANRIGIRNTLFYAIMGIGGLWLAILLSGVHATIAAVLAAFTIPTTRKINTSIFLRKVRWLTYDIKSARKKKKSNPETDDDISNTIGKFSSLVEDATPPLQRLEHSLHPFVSFVVLPIFAFANAGVTLTTEAFGFFTSPVTLGVICGLILGKLFGVVLFTRLLLYFKLGSLPEDVSVKHIYGIGILSAIGFTMSLFITELAFIEDDNIVQAKIGILTASLIAGLLGFFYLKYISREKQQFQSAETSSSQPKKEKLLKTTEIDT